MTRLEKIEKDIAALGEEDLRKLAQWFAAFQSDLWDRQIEEDHASGLLDALIEEAKREVAEGKTHPL